MRTYYEQLDDVARALISAYDESETERTPYRQFTFVELQGTNKQKKFGELVRMCFVQDLDAHIVQDNVTIWTQDVYTYLSARAHKPMSIITDSEWCDGVWHIGYDDIMETAGLISEASFWCSMCKKDLKVVLSEILQVLVELKDKSLKVGYEG